MKYFLHAYIPPQVTPEYTIPDTVSCIAIVRWEIEPNALRAYLDLGAKRLHQCLYSFFPDARYYIVANHGQCMEPNGDIIWRWEGGFGDEKAAA